MTEQETKAKIDAILSKETFDLGDYEVLAREIERLEEIARRKQFFRMKSQMRQAIFERRENYA